MVFGPIYMYMTHTHNRAHTQISLGFSVLMYQYHNYNRTQYPCTCFKDLDDSTMLWWQAKKRKEHRLLRAIRSMSFNFQEELRVPSQFSVAMFHCL